MLNGFEESIKGMELSDDVRATLIKNANDLSTGLSDKNAELLNKNKSLSDMSVSEKELALSGQEKLTALEKFKTDSELKDAETASNYDAAKILTAEAHQTALNTITEASAKLLEDANTKSSGFESQLKTIMVDQAITAELVKLDVSKDLMETWQDSISIKTTLTDGKAMVGDESLSDYMKKWADSPAGKASRLAPNNNGGGANGGDNKSTNNSSNKVKTSSERAAAINDKFKKL